VEIQQLVIDKLQAVADEVNLYYTCGCIVSLADRWSSIFYYGKMNQ